MFIHYNMGKSRKLPNVIVYFKVLEYYIKWSLVTKKFTAF